MRSWVTQVRKGIVELAVLAALRRGEAYGYQLLQRLNAIEGLGFSESSVYPLLARLTEEGLVKVRAAPSPHGPPRRYYQLTADGRHRLELMVRHWRDVHSGIDALLSEEPHP